MKLIKQKLSEKEKKEKIEDIVNTIIQGDCLEVLETLPDNLIDSIIIDPPYGLGFMGKEWDNFNMEKLEKNVKNSSRKKSYLNPLRSKDVRKSASFSFEAGRYDRSIMANINFQNWVEKWAKECLRILKPGGYFISFGSPRTYHRLVCGIEDAGFEIRDSIMWVFGSGFPKSLNIGKAIDKLQKNKREIVNRNPNSRENCDKSNSLYEPGTVGKTDYITKGNSKWEGWGTALKPAYEPICFARKPLSKKNVAENVLEYGTGGINIDSCRIPMNDNEPDNRVGTDFVSNGGDASKNKNDNQVPNKFYVKMYKENGRWPANFIHDGSEEVFNLFPNSNGSAMRFFYCAKTSQNERNIGLDGSELKYKDITRKPGSPGGSNPINRGAEKPHLNFHPTVKPLSLMRYLCRLVTPKNGIILDCFTGSGSTLVAAKQEGFNFIGIEKEKDYCEIANKRIASIPQTLL